MVDSTGLIVIQYYKEFNLMIYDPAKDRSEEFGWKKLCNEHVPTEQEQDFWAMRLTAASLLVVLLGDWHGIFYSSY